jgi:hypothetical protein
MFMHFQSRKDRQMGVSSKRGMYAASLCPYTLSIHGWLYQFGTDLSSEVNVDDTSTRAAIWDLEELLVVL